MSLSSLKKTQKYLPTSNIQNESKSFQGFEKNVFKDIFSGIPPPSVWGQVQKLSINGFCSQDESF